MAYYYKQTSDVDEPGAIYWEYFSLLKTRLSLAMSYK